MHATGPLLLYLPHRSKSKLSEFENPELTKDRRGEDGASYSMAVEKRPVVRNWTGSVQL